jgi:predicted DCC family thiol-disulfide oxidoreductase YuxK
MDKIPNPRPVIFFDGVCGLCNGFVDFILKVDKHKKFHFSPLQGALAKSKLSDEQITDLKSVVLASDNKIFIKSQAVLEILTQLGGFWMLAVVLKIFPNFVLNIFYDLIAKYRYKLFGKKETCRIPSPEERERFIP